MAEVTGKEIAGDIRNCNAEHLERDLKVPTADKINQPNAEIYLHALERYPNDEAIDREDERRLKRKLDMRIIPLLGVCYFFYVSCSGRSPNASGHC